jgi:hypothetical protein
MEPAVARRLWTVLEPYHATVYFSPEVGEAMKGLGLKGYWMGYFAGRGAPLGPVPSTVIEATFFNFRPSMVQRAIPDAWGFASPSSVTAARVGAVDATLRRLLGDEAGGPGIAEAAALARRAVDGAGVEGRPLYAAWAAVDWAAEDQPHMVLWHAATLLREHRGDGHVAALTYAGLDGCEAHVTTVASGRIARDVIQPARGWTDEEWDAATERLRRRGWLGEDGRLSEAGAEARQALEEDTDRLALGPCRAIGAEGVARLIELVRPLAGRIVEQGAVPMPNPMGAPAAQV